MDKKRKIEHEMVDTWVNGNIEDFKKWVFNCSKLQLLNAIEYYTANYGGRHIAINRIRNLFGGGVK